MCTKMCKLDFTVCDKKNPSFSLQKKHCEDRQTERKNTPNHQLFILSVVEAVC